MGANQNRHGIYFPARTGNGLLPAVEKIPRADACAESKSILFSFRCKAEVDHQRDGKVVGGKLVFTIGCGNVVQHACWVAGEYNG